MTTLRLGTRRSALALAQSGMMARALELAHPGLRVELVEIVTRGDTTPGDLSKIGGKGLFTEELEAGLLDGSLDLAVHSLKDLPVRLPAGLTVAAYPERADARDALVSKVARDLADLPSAAKVLTGSGRRAAQILRLRPDVEVVPVRGNVDTRLDRWRDSGAAGVLLAQAGLDRLGLSGGGLPAHPLDPETFLPAPGQGTLAIETASGSAAERLVAALDDPRSARAAKAERALVEALGGDCTLPLGAWARDVEGGVRLDAFLSTPDASRWTTASAIDPDPLTVAELCRSALDEQGAAEILARIHDASG